MDSVIRKAIRWFGVPGYGLAYPISSNPSVAPLRHLMTESRLKSPFTLKN
jgi:hypothetical protein